VTRLAVLAGGPSPEYEVSLETGEEMCALLREGDHAVQPVHVSRRGAWCFGGPRDTFAGLADVPGVTEDQALRRLVRQGAVAVLGLHGAFGEDGQIQRRLERYGVPFTGSGSAASSLAMDKILTKARASAVGARVAPHQVGYPAERWPDALRPGLGPPCIVKPVHSGSSVGLTLVRARGELEAAVARAAAEDPMGEAMIERYVPGIEASCSVLREGGRLRTLPLLAIEPAGGLYDYHAKYVAEDTVIACPADLPRRAGVAIEQVSRALYAGLELRGVVRVDFRVEEHTGTPYFLELNTLPGFTSHSLVPRAADAAGMTRRAVIEAAIAQARAHARARDA